MRLDLSGKRPTKLRIVDEIIKPDACRDEAGEALFAVARGVCNTKDGRRELDAACRAWRRRRSGLGGKSRPARLCFAAALGMIRRRGNVLPAFRLVAFYGPAIQLDPGDERLCSALVDRNDRPEPFASRCAGDGRLRVLVVQKTVGERDRSLRELRPLRFER